MRVRLGNSHASVQWLNKMGPGKMAASRKRLRAYVLQQVIQMRHPSHYAQIAPADYNLPPRTMVCNRTGAIKWLVSRWCYLR